MAPTTLKLNNTDDGTYYGITLGASLPFRRTLSKLHTSLDVGRLGTTTNGLVQETYVRLTLGISFNDKWFIPRKYMTNGKNKYDIHSITRTLLPGVLFLLVVSCKNDPEQIRALTGQGNKQQDRAEDVTVIYSKDGRIKMRLFARDFVRNDYAKPAYVDMNRNLKAEFYNDSGVVENVLTADSSRYYIAQGNVLVWDSVQIISRKGERLNTSELIWNQSIEKFFTEKAVTITTPTEVIYGNGMEANSDFSWYRITNPKGTVQVNKGEVPQ